MSFTITTHYKYITAEKKVLLCRIEIVTCIDKNQLCGNLRQIRLQEKLLSQKAKPHD